MDLSELLESEDKKTRFFGLLKFHFLIWQPIYERAYLASTKMPSAQVIEMMINGTDEETSFLKTTEIYEGVKIPALVYKCMVDFEMMACEKLIRMKEEGTFDRQVLLEQQMR